MNKTLVFLLSTCAMLALAGCPKPGPGPGPNPSVCGGIAGTACPDGQYCDLGSLCAMPDAQGKCVAKPEVCPAMHAPVCGCDGKTYGNACTAASAGISVVRAGECEQSAAE